MVSTPLHPMLVHLPLALAVLIPLIASALLMAWLLGWLPKRTWAVVVCLQGILLASGALAMEAGEDDEEFVERVVAEQSIEHHEEAAELFTWASGLLLALSLTPLLMRNRRRARTAGWLTVAGSCVVLGLAYRTGSAGADLVYVHGAAAVYAAGGDAGMTLPAWTGHDDDDDDDDD